MRTGVFFGEYFWDPGELTVEEVQSRQFFYMNEWLISEEYRSLTSEQYSELQLKIWNLFLQYFFSRKDIYDDSKPSKFAQRVIANPLFLESDNVKKVVILSRNISDTQAESKKRFMEKFLNHPKISYVSIAKGESKCDALKHHKINFDVFVDDEIPNIRNVAEGHEDLTGKEFILPRYGYNKMPQELKFLIESRGGTFTYFEPF